jgi:hypothetical protein
VSNSSELKNDLRDFLDRCHEPGRKVPVSFLMLFRAEFVQHRDRSIAELKVAAEQLRFSVYGRMPDETKRPVAKPAPTTVNEFQKLPDVGNNEFGPASLELFKDMMSGKYYGTVGPQTDDDTFVVTTYGHFMRERRAIQLLLKKAGITLPD